MILIFNVKLTINEVNRDDTDEHTTLFLIKFLMLFGIKLGKSDHMISSH